MYSVPVPTSRAVGDFAETAYVRDPSGKPMEMCQLVTTRMISVCRFK